MTDQIEIRLSRARISLENGLNLADKYLDPVNRLDLLPDEMEINRRVSYRELELRVRVLERLMEAIGFTTENQLKIELCKEMETEVTKFADRLSKVFGQKVTLI